MTTIDGHDFAAIHAAVEKAKLGQNNKPKFIIAKTEIGRGIPEVAGTAKAHGEGGAKFVDAAKKGLGIPEGTHFYVGDDLRAPTSPRKRRPVPRSTPRGRRPTMRGPRPIRR